MDKLTEKQIKDAINIINSTIINCEKIQPKLKDGSPQLSLNKNRIKALYIAKTLITNQKHDYKKDELLKSVDQITSIINKSKSGISHAKEGTGTYTRFKKIIDSMIIALLYIEDTINKSYF